MIESGADVNITDAGGYTLLHKAISKVSKLLLPSLLYLGYFFTCAQLTQLFFSFHQYDK